MTHLEIIRCSDVKPELYSLVGKTIQDRLRRNLPYGMWTCADGREILYNRHYKPIWQRYPNKPAERANINEWVEHITKQIYFFNDYDMPWYDFSKSRAARSRVERVLTDFLCGNAITEKRHGYQKIVSRLEENVTGL